VTALVPPAYGRASLGDLLPAVLSSLGVADTGSPASAVSLPPASRVCVFLVDGLGYELLASADPSDAPFLQSLLPGGGAIDAGFPTSTPISLCSLGTGRTPGEHGIVGFTMHVPPVAHVLECLAWTGYGSRVDLSAMLPPETLQPCEPLLALAAADGIATTVVSLSVHVGSGLSRAAFRGATFDSIPAFDDMEARVRLVSGGLQRSDRTIVYTYDARLDTAAHVAGVGSAAWRAALRETDEAAETIAEWLPAGTLLIITGDHGALNVPTSKRIDLAARPELSRGVAWFSGDPRTRHVHAEPGQAESMVGRWKDSLGDEWAVLTRDEAIETGLFGPAVRDDVRPRIGDLVAIALGGQGLFDQSRFPWEFRLEAFHGALTPAELRVPLLQYVA
jgi:hypothetical protein